MCVASLAIIGSASGGDTNSKNETVTISTGEPMPVGQQQMALSGFCGNNRVNIRVADTKAGPRVYVTVHDSTMSYGTEAEFVRDLFAGKGAYQLTLSCGQGVSVWVWGVSFADPAKPRFVKAQLDFSSNGSVAQYSHLLDENYTVVRGYLR
jgi:hypothetical protein